MLLQRVEYRMYITNSLSLDALHIDKIKVVRQQILIIIDTYLNRNGLIEKIKTLTEK